jgi:hypothetical protein
MATAPLPLAAQTLPLQEQALLLQEMQSLLLQVLQEKQAVGHRHVDVEHGPRKTVPASWYHEPGRADDELPAVFYVSVAP